MRRELSPKERQCLIATLGLLFVSMQAIPVDAVKANNPESGISFYAEQQNEYLKNFVLQKYDNSCAAAILAMMLADKQLGEVNFLNEQITDYFDFAHKPGLSVGVLGMEDYLIEVGQPVTVGQRNSPWKPGELEEHLETKGSTVIVVTSKYGKATKNNVPNHWIIVDEIIVKDNVRYAVVRDPLRDKNATRKLRKLSSFMKPYENGSILIPIDKLVPALGLFYLNVEDPESEN